MCRREVARALRGSVRTVGRGREKLEDAGKDERGTGVDEEGERGRRSAREEGGEPVDRVQGRR